MVIRDFKFPGLFASLSIVMGSMALAISVTAATPPEADWETPRPTPRTDTGDYSPYVDPQFTSAKSLSGTTAWLTSAIEQYGDVPADAYDPGNSYRVTTVRFQGCSMEWVEQRSIDGGSAVVEHAYTLALGDVSFSAGGLQVARNSLTVSLSASQTPMPLHFVERMYHREDGALKPTSATWRSDNSFVLMLQNKDDIVRRIGTALIHAARLCVTSVR